jgi:predicted amidohydrolase YtcJ
MECTHILIKILIALGGVILTDHGFSRQIHTEIECAYIETVETVFIVVLLIEAERMKHCFPFRLPIEAGVVVAGSSDAQTEVDNPMFGIRAAIKRHQ